MDIDLYEFKETIKKFEDTDLSHLNLSQDKAVAVIEVGKCKDKAINKKLKSLGHKFGERVLVVVQ